MKYEAFIGDIIRVSALKERAKKQKLQAEKRQEQQQNVRRIQHKTRQVNQTQKISPHEGNENAARAAMIQFNMKSRRILDHVNTIIAGTEEQIRGNAEATDKLVNYFRGKGHPVRNFEDCGRIIKETQIDSLILEISEKMNLTPESKGLFASMARMQ